MKISIVTEVLQTPTTTDWGALGILAIVAFFAIIGQMWASKRLLWMKSDAYQLSIAYLGSLLITGSFLYFGVYS